MEKKSKSSSRLNRREFLTRTAALGTAITIVPSHVISGLGHTPPSDKLNIAGIGVGGQGFWDLKQMLTENIVALCDVDWKYSKRTFELFPEAKRFKDWRVMFDEMGKSIDALVVATPDHTHALPAAHGLALGKHVYLEKPLTHAVYESRLLTKLAAKHGVATTMGNHGASEEGVNLICEWIANGEIGEVTKVEAFTDRPIWPQGLNTPAQGHWVPEHFDWDLFIGPAAMRPYNEIYHPWNWRGWWDFGTGALGDMACHILHPVFVGLELDSPLSAQGSSSLLMKDCAPTAQSVKLTFPERIPSSKMKIKLPKIDVFWYDGGIKPPLPDDWPAGKNPNDDGGGVIFHGTKDTLVCGCYGRNPWLLSGKVPEVTKWRRRIETNHQMDWVRACKESPKNRIPTASDFKEAGPFNEMVVMGVLAVRLQGLNKTLDWDGTNMKFTNISETDSLKMVVSDNFAMVDGKPVFEKKWTEEIPAMTFANELIRHTYREPWKLPDMP